jgi:hypothetical protein
MLRPAPATGSTSAPGLSPHRHQDWRTSAPGLSPHPRRDLPTSAPGLEQISACRIEILHGALNAIGHSRVIWVLYGRCRACARGTWDSAALQHSCATRQLARANYSLQPDALPVRRARGAPQRYSAAPRGAPPATPYASVAAAPNAAPLACVAWRMLQRSRALVACGSATCRDAAPRASVRARAARVRASVRSRVLALAHGSLCRHPFLSSARCWRSPSSALGTRAERCPRGLGWALSASWFW